jgi:hypothetical protein
LDSILQENIMTKNIAVAVATLSLFACQDRRAERVESSTNPDFRVERLFTHEGCTTYRFEDYYTHYYTVCDSGKMVRNEEMVSCGKNCTRPQESTTIVTDGGCR